MFELIRPIPPIAWIPLTVFWFGIGLTGKVFIIWIAGIVPCVINSYVGVRMTSPVLIQMARTYGASDWQIFCQLCIPSALPMVFGALQLALAYCWTNLVAAELLAADSGLGFLITMGGRLGRPDIIVCARHGAVLGGARPLRARQREPRAERQGACREASSEGSLWQTTDLTNRNRI